MSSFNLMIFDLKFKKKPTGSSLNTRPSCYGARERFLSARSEDSLEVRARCNSSFSSPFVPILFTSVPIF